MQKNCCIIILNKIHEDEKRNFEEKKESRAFKE